MPVLKHAKKKMRQDKKRTLRNKQFKVIFRALLKKAKQSPTKETVSEAYSSLDKAAKKNIIHENKAARLKSSLSKLLVAKPQETVKAETKQPTNAKKVTKKGSKKSAKK